MVIDSKGGRALIAGGRPATQRGDTMAEERTVATEWPKAGEPRPKRIRVTAVKPMNGWEFENEDTGKKKLVQPGQEITVPYETAIRLASGENPRVVVGKEAGAIAKKAAERAAKIREERAKEAEAIRKARLKNLGLA